MKLTVEEVEQNKEEEIIIRCHEMNEEIMRVIHKIKLSDTSFVGYDGECIHKIRPEEVYYFESVDNKTYIYCKERIFESRQRLYEIEEICDGSKFFRASKSTIVNAGKISYIRPAFSGRFEAHLLNGEDVVISRQYVPILKQLLGM